MNGCSQCKEGLLLGLVYRREKVIIISWKQSSYLVNTCYKLNITDITFLYAYACILHSLSTGGGFVTFEHRFVQTCLMLTSRCGTDELVGTKSERS